MATASSIKWKQHPVNLANTCKNIFQGEGLFTDAVIVCGQRKFPCHRALLSASSEFFGAILAEHPVFFEPLIVLEDVEESFVEAILKYLYTGIITIDAMKAGNFLQVCSYFRIKGLMSYDLFSSDDQYMEEEKAVITPMVETVTESIIDSLPLIEIAIEEEQTEMQHQHQEQQQVHTAMEEIYDESCEAEDLLVFLKAESHQSTPNTTKSQTTRNRVEKESNAESFPPKTASAPQAQTSEPLTSPSVQPTATKRKPPTVRLSTAETTIKQQEKKRRSAETYTEDQLNLSMEAVCNGEMNLCSASAKFNVPKTVLWRKLQKRGDYSGNPMEKRREAAKEALRNGQPIQAVSEKFNVALSTLYRDQQKLVEEGQLESRRRSKNDTEDALQKAIKACEEGMAQSEAARIFNVSKSTLWRKMRKS